MAQKLNDKSDESETAQPPHIVRDFDKLCFEFGDRDAILMNGSDPVSYFELQEHSKVLAYQLYHRFGWPDYILVDCQESPAAEAVATLACMRICRPFVPVSSTDQHRPGRMNAVVDLLIQKGKRYTRREDEQGNKDEDKDKIRTRNDHPPSIVAVVVCENDRDPLLSVFQQAGVHQILYLDPSGGIRECLSVPEGLRLKDIQQSSSHDDLYVMFTSGTSTTNKSNSTSSAKAVVGSHRATHARLRWFLDSFPSSPRIGRRTKLTFVDGVTELWGGLLDAMNVLVAVPPAQLRGRGVIALVEDMQCTQLLLLPSQANQLLLASSEIHSCSNLDRVIVSGEVCSSVLLEQFITRYPRTQLINLYGQTETTGDCLCAVLSDLGKDAIVNNVVAVGKPTTTGFQITSNDALQDDDGAVENDNQDSQQYIHESFKDEQLIIKGSHLSNGYLGSSSNFDQFLPGDVGFCHNGLWYVRGRVDDVLKINGVLTSLSEIESAFCKAYDIRDYVGVVAVAIENKAKLLCTNREAVQLFSRLHMHNEVGIPLNLIPSQVILVPSIPRSSSGAKKIDRKACKRLVQSLGSSEQTKSTSSLEGTSKRKAERNVVSITADVLGLHESDVDSTKSFVELGGDSASSITLLYRLKQEIRNVADFTATDILWSESLNELDNMATGVIEKQKRPKRESDKLVPETHGSKQFVPQASLEVQSWHRSIPLLACVDSSPLLIGKSIISACHGGVILRFSSNNGDIEAYRHYPGWMFQADLILLDGSEMVLVCGYSSLNKGVVICLTCDLKKEEWKLDLDESIKCSPVVFGDNAWVLSGDRLIGVNLRNGQSLDSHLQLPRSPCVSNPIIIEREGGQKNIAFASSDWEGGIVLMDSQKMESKIHLDCEIGPVHKDMNATRKSRGIFISDIYGNLHVLDPKAMVLSSSIQLASNPLTAPTIFEQGRIVVGSYDGRLYCTIYNQKTGQLEKQWERDCYSSIYSKPLDFGDGLIVVCTTAGYIFKISTLTGEVQSSRKIPAEIWSSPVKIEGKNIIAVGARDSQCHLVSI